MEDIGGTAHTAQEAGRRPGRTANHEAGRLLSFYQRGLKGYTYFGEAHAR